MSSKKVTGKESIMEVVREHPEAAEAFFKHGMHCLGCAAAQFENIEQGCQAHGIDPKLVVDDINKILEESEKKEKNPEEKE